MKLPASNPRRYWLTLCAGSLFILACSMVPSLGAYLPPRVITFFYSISIASENTVGAWWSGMLLLLGALHFGDGYFRYRQAEPPLALAWLVIGSVLLALSADEIGSFHERLDKWYLIAPFGAVLLAAAGWAYWQLLTRPEHRRNAVLIAIGFGLFVSVAGQEIMEHLVEWPQGAKRWRMLVEEGTEIVGMLLLISVGMKNSTGLFKTPSVPAAGQGPALQAATAMPGGTLLLAAALAPVLSLFSTRFHDGTRGHPGDWLAAALLMLACIATLRPFLTGRELPRGRVPMAVVLLFASVICVRVAPDTVRTVGTWDINARVVLLSALAFGASVLMAWSVRRVSGPSVVLAGLGAMLAFVAAHTPSLYEAFTISIVCALVMYCVANPGVLRRTHAKFIGPHDEAGSMPSLLESAREAVILWRMDGGGIQYWNPAAERLYGYAQYEALGKVTHEMLGTRAEGAQVGELEENLARYGLWVGSLRHRTRDGRIIRVQSRLSLLPQLDGSWLVLEVNQEIPQLAAAAVEGVQGEQPASLLRNRTAAAVAGA